MLTGQFSIYYIVSIYFNTVCRFFKWPVLQSIWIVALLSLVLTAHAAPPGGLLGDSALQLTRVGHSKIPVFSSIDGYVCFFLTAEVIRPATRKIGVFSVPKHGLSVKNMCLDLRQPQASRQDWLKILDLVEPLRQMDLKGQLRVELPAVGSPEFIAASMPVVFEDEIYVQLSETPRRVLILAHSAETDEIYWELKSNR